MTVNIPQFSELASEKEDVPSYFPYIDRVIVLSPHYDDAVLSMGSLIHHFIEREVQVDIVNVFTTGSEVSTPLTKKLLQQAGFENVDDYFRARKAEDASAFQLLGNVRLNYFNYVDAPWRGEKGQPHYPDGYFNRPHKDTLLTHNLVATLHSYLSIDHYDLIFAPLGVGRHIDHMIVREAAGLLGHQRIMYYADFPYIMCADIEHGYIQTNNLRGFEWVGKYEKKAQSILAYKTQYACLFGNKPMNLPLEKYYSCEKMIF